MSLESGSSARTWSWVFTESMKPAWFGQGWIWSFMCGYRALPSRRA